LFSATVGLPVKSLLAENDGTRSAGAVITGRVECAGKGIEKAVVSDGFSVALTKADGSYQLQSHDNAEFVFVSMPAGYDVENDRGIARFYHKISKDKDKQELNFRLTKLPVDDHKHAFIVWADTQVWDKKDSVQLKTVSAPDTAEVVRSLGKLPVHGISVGDMVWDKFELFPDYMDAVETTGITFFQLIGNHDMDIKTARTDDQSQEKFKSLFGPTYYSFNRGKVHYVVLDDVFFIGTAKRYIGYITEEQLEWLEKDLSFVPHGSTVMVCLHIPTNTGDAKRRQLAEDELGGVVSNREHLYALLKQYNVHILSGHTHWNENWEKDNIMEHNHGTVCGAWWTGPICGDGTPNGYCVYEVNGNDVSWYYKATGKQKDHQLRIHGKGAVPENPKAIMANVWNWDPKWKVEWMEDNMPKGVMQQYMGYDPVAYDFFIGPDKPARHKFTEPNLTDHLFIAEPSANARLITVKATDRFGNVYTETIQIA